MRSVPVSVGIPTFGRGLRLTETLERIARCDPRPAEVIVHVDASNGELERHLSDRFPYVHLLSSSKRVGPGGGRHRCIQAASQPIFTSFDDDSWPVDGDFFAEIVQLFEYHSGAAVLASSVYHQNQSKPNRSTQVRVVADYVGCGYAIRVNAYRETGGHIDRDCPYGLEEVDLAMQLFALGWAILQCDSLRVFHDTQLFHHSKPETVAGTVQNVALRAFLRYPVALWPRGVLQLGNTVLGMVKRGRFAGLGEGLWGIPAVLLRHADQRHVLPREKVLSYLNARPRLTP